jgi:hypothetical protein
VLRPRFRSRKPAREPGTQKKYGHGILGRQESRGYMGKKLDIWDIWDIYNYIYICIYIYIGYVGWKNVKISMKVGKETRYVSSFEQYLCSPGGSPFHPRRNDATTASALGDCCEHPESESRGG